MTATILLIISNLSMQIHFTMFIINSILDHERHAIRYICSSISYPMPSRSKNKSVRFVRLQMIKIQIEWNREVSIVGYIEKKKITKKIKLCKR